MSDKNTGGPAFPLASESGMWPASVGMTLRDYFAAKAMQGMLPMDSDNGRYRDEGVLKRTAEIAYDMADAMLEARDK